ncbi:Signal transduction histidine kinase [Geodermatophilus siccatus]|uniref:histidine kinase n=1 Tax=Geodermatophilus siccatus TaxID=1137991 RepID=A0A1G9RW57_9ACTN|nr:ATP-binding protein [Geodermatophilus siccatus]SDM27260.1 Signal transduction histidine kinase [Geodermatophilus siccatus]
MATEPTTVVAPAVDPGWVVLGDGAAGTRPRPASPSVGRVVLRFVLANLVAVVLLLAGGLWAGVEAAEDEALADARRTTDLLAAVLVQPLVDERLVAGDPATVAAVDAALRERLAQTPVLRVKIWTAEGRVVYSDEARLIGLTYPLDDADRQTLRDGVTRAAVSDLSRPENRFEHSAGRLLEVYGLIEGPDGEPLLLETYSEYSEATERRFEIWVRFAPISMVVLLTLVVVQLPLARRMVTQLRATQQERERLQARALDVSTEERRLIAGSLHDGVVQDVSASALLVARAADDLATGRDRGQHRQVAEVLGQAAGALREAVRSLRSLLVEIHPPTLEGAGLPGALADLTARLRPRGITVRLAVAEDLEVEPATATLLLSTAQEALRNVVKHARSSSVAVTVAQRPGQLVLEVADDGVGFDVAPAAARSREGHLGLRLLSDRAAAAGATLAVHTAPGAGTTLRLEVPRP